MSTTKKNYGWVLVWFFFFAIVINYLDRNNLSYAATTIQKEFNLTPVQLGSVLAAFLLPYGLSSLVAGYLVDRIGPKVVFVWSIILWSLSTIAAGMSHSFETLYISRVFLGITEAPCYLVALVVCKKWLEEKELAIGTSIFNLGPPVAGILAPPVLTTLIMVFDWRIMFYTLGMLGLLAVIPWFFLYREPREGDPSFGLVAKSEHKVTLAEYRTLFMQKTTLVLMLAYFGVLWVQFVFLTWLPSYLQMSRGISLFKTGIFSLIPFFCGLLGTLAGGYASSYLIKRGMNAVTARKTVIVSALILSGLFIIPVNYIQSFNTSITFMSIAYFFLNLIFPNTWALAGDIAPDRLTGTLGAIQNFGGFMGGFIGPIVVGYIVETTKSFDLVFVVAGIMLLFSSCIYGFFLKNKIEM